MSNSSNSVQNLDTWRSRIFGSATTLRTGNVTVPTSFEAENFGPEILAQGIALDVCFF
jgi:hypothetical protein